MRIYIPKKYLLFREDARVISKTVHKQKKMRKNVYLDFSEVHFISRSFTDELLNIINDLHTGGAMIKFQNLNPSLKKMLNQVKKHKTKIQKAIV